MALELKSSAFQNGQDIPDDFTCKGADISPQLAWIGAPEKTKSFVLIMDDPDAPVGTWVHWVVYDIPATETGLEEGIPADPLLTSGAKQGVSSFRKVGYGGPCPPPGPKHRYFFKLYALDMVLDLPAGKASKNVTEKAMEGHVLEKAELVGTYGR